MEKPNSQNTVEEGGCAAEKGRIRDQLQSDIQAFLASGGKVELVENDVRADPPKKPDSHYGSNPI